MAPRKPRTESPTGMAPTIPDTPTQSSSFLAGLPENLSIALPDFASQVPTDYFRPSSSPVPRIDSATFKEESKIAAEQNNSLQLQAMNLDNVILTVGNAVKSTKIGELLGQYLIGIESIRTVGVRLRNTQALTFNAEKQVLITAEKGRQLDVKLQGEQMKTQLEAHKNAIIQTDVDGYAQLLPIAQQAWQQRLDEAASKNAEMLDRYSN